MKTFADITSYKSSHAMPRNKNEHVTENSMPCSYRNTGENIFMPEEITKTMEKKWKENTYQFPNVSSI